MKKFIAGLAIGLLLLLPSFSLGALDSRIDGLMDERHWDGSNIGSLALPAGAGWNCYVATTGSSSNPGTEGSPKRQVSQCLDRYNRPTLPVHIIIKAGKYKAWMSVPENWGQSGYDKGVVIGPYGDGEVIIDNTPWDLLGTWEDVGGGIWRVQPHIRVTFGVNRTRGSIAENTPITQTSTGATALLVGYYNYNTDTIAYITDYVGSANYTNTWYPTADGNDTTNALTPLSSSPGPRKVDYNVDWIVIDDDFKTYRDAESFAALDSLGEWYFRKNDETNAGWLYIYTGFDPTSHDVMIQPYDVDGAGGSEWFAGSSSYTTLYGLVLRGNKSTSYSNAPYLTYDHCIIKNNGKAFSNYATNTHIISNIIQGNVLRNWPRGNHGWCDTDGGWPNAGHGWQNTIYARNITFDNGGEGSQNGPSSEIRDNIYVDNFSLNGEYIGADSNKSYHNNIAVSTYVDPYEIRGYPSPPCVNWEKTRRKLKGSFTGIESEYGCSGTVRASGSKVFNNISIGERYGVSHVEQCGGYYIDNVTVVGNTFVTSGDLVYDRDYNRSIVFYLASRSTNNGVWKNNVLLGTNAYTLLMERGNDGPAMDFDYNVYYHPTLSQPFKLWGYNNTTYNFADYKTAFGADANSIYSDPLLTKTNWVDVSALTLADVSLQSGSPARGEGTNLGSEYNYDYYYATRTNWDAGAIEYGGTPNLFSDTENLYDGQVCAVNGDCQSGYCCDYVCNPSTCGVVPSPTPTPTPDPAQPTPTPTPTPPPAGSELLTNGDFELGTTGWTGVWGGSLADETSIVRGGSHSILSYGRSDAYQGPTQNISTPLIVNGQLNYTFSGYMRLASGSGIGKVTIEIDDSTGRHWFLGPQTAITSTGWTKVEATLNLTWTGSITNAYIYFETVGTTGNFYTDDASLKVYVPPTNNDSNRTFRGIQNIRTLNLLEGIRTFFKKQ